MPDWADESWDFLSGDLERDRRNLRLLMDTAEELYGVLDLEERMERAVDRAILVTGAEKGLLFVEQGGRLVLRIARDASGHGIRRGVKYSHSCVEDVWNSGRPVFEQGTMLDVRPTQSVIDEQILSILATRLTYEGRPVGVLYVHATFETKNFTEADQQAFLALGGLIATAVKNAQLAEASAERARLRGNVKRAREVQQRLQPRGIFAPAGYDMAGVGRVCQDLSGDYYDVVVRPDGRVALAIGDVSDHGISTALHAATARALLRRMMAEDQPAEATLDMLSCALEQDMEDREFMSLFLALLDPGGREIVWSNAGHIPPLLRRAQGGVISLDGAEPVLGQCLENAHTLRGPVAFDAGDILLLYTDGVYEARGADGTIWGEERLRASFDRHAGTGRDAQGILAALLADVDAYRKHGPLDDDITCLVVRAV